MTIPRQIFISNKSVSLLLFLRPLFLKLYCRIEKQFFSDFIDLRLVRASLLLNLEHYFAWFENKAQKRCKRCKLISNLFKSEIKKAKKSEKSILLCPGKVSGFYDSFAKIVIEI